MKKLFFIASFFMLLGMTACSSKDRDVLAVEQLIHRLIPQYADRFVFEIVPEEDRDYYLLESKDGKIHISGNNANSMAAGLNYYLKYYCYGSLKSIEEATNYLHCSRRQLQRILKKLCDEGKMIKEGKGKYKIKGRNFSPLIIKHLTFC